MSAESQEIKFISYGGRPKFLCEGTLTLEINGDVVSFGDSAGCDYPRFWQSRGDCGGDKGRDAYWEPHRAGWVIKKGKIPPRYENYGEKFISLMEQNIRPICYGGCREGY